MTKPLGKRTIMPKAVRPWSQGDRGKERPIHKETPREIKERPICLSCNLPTCPNIDCPLTEITYESKRRPNCGPTEEFLDWAWGPMSAKEWAEKIGVDASTIRRWKRKYADEIEKRRKKRRP